MEIEVKGHSGCQIDIVRENKELYIFKSSSDKKYLNRLLRQAEKQRSAALYEYQHIRVPQIFDIFQDDSSVSIKMEYVYSKNFVEYFESAGFEQINYLIKALILFIEKELSSSPLSVVNSSIVKEKFQSVKENVRKSIVMGSDDEIKAIIEKSQFIFDALQNIEMPVGICHGDLTFSNILFNGNNYYLIDFLDSFIESPLLDIVKIRQDSAFLWSQLMYTKSFDELRLRIVCEKIDKEINQYFQKYEWYRNYYNVFQLMNMLRILQYAKEDKVIVYLKKQINLILNEF